MTATRCGVALLRPNQATVNSCAAGTRNTEAGIKNNEEKGRQMGHGSSGRSAADWTPTRTAFPGTGSRRVRGRHAWTSVMLAAGMLLLAACGNSTPSAGGSNTTGQTTPATSSSATSAKGTPYLIGNILEVQTPFVTYPPSYSDTPTAFEEWTNAHGGINGHPIKIISIDDHADAAKSLAAAQQLISNDHVIALAGLANPSTESAYEQFVTQSGVPVVGSAYSSIAATNPDWFQTAAGSYTITGYSRALAAKLAGVTKYGIMYCTEVPACKLDYSTQVTAAKRLGGISVVKTIPAAIASPNFTTPCIQMRAAGINGLYFSSSVEGIARAAVDCVRQGVHVVHVMGESGPQLLQTQQVWQYGAAGADMTMPYWADVPQTQNYHNAMQQYFPTDELTAASAQEWASFEVLQAALEKVPNDPMTPATVKKGLYLLPDGFHTDMSVPVHYKAGQPSVVKCFYLWTIKNGKYELTKGANFECVP
jgi:branched-chain amino acid transport system substrate-binding protein